MGKLWRQHPLGKFPPRMSYPISLPSHLDDLLCFLLSLTRAFPFSFFLQNESRNAVTSQEASHLGAWKTQNCFHTSGSLHKAQGYPPEASTVVQDSGGHPSSPSFFLKHRTFSSTKMVRFNSRYKTDSERRLGVSKPLQSPFSLSWSQTCIYPRECLGCSKTQPKRASFRRKHMSFVIKTDLGLKIRSVAY